MTNAQLGITVTSNADNAAADLDRLTASATKAEQSTKKLGASSRTSGAATEEMGRGAAAASTATAHLERTIDMAAAAQGRAVVSAQAHTAAMQANAAAARMNSQMQRQLMFQMVDMGQALPLLLSGNIYGLQNMGFQIAQIGQLYYGQGGMGAALRDMGKMLGGAAVRMGPLALAAGAVTAVLAGVTYEMNKTAETAVSMGDVALAALQLLAEGIGAAMAPAVNQLVSWFAQLWDLIFPHVKNAVNGLIGGFVGAYQAIVDTWQNLPDVFSGIGKMAWNSLVAELEKPLLTFGDTTLIPGLNLAGAKAELTDGEMAALGVAGASFNAGAGRDYVGEAMDAWSTRAQEIAKVRNEVEATDSALGGANDNAKKLGDTLSEAAKRAQEEFEFLRSTFSGFVLDMSRGLREGESFWEAFGSAAVNALNKIIDRYLEMLASNLFANLFGGLFGGGFTVPSGFVSGGYYPAFPGYASGTNYAAGGWSWVGERGPELINLPRGSQVMSHTRSVAYANQNTPAPANSNTPTVNFNGGINIRAEGSSGDDARDQKYLAELQRGVKATIRQEISEQMRPGGLLNPRLG